MSRKSTTFYDSELSNIASELLAEAQLATDDQLVKARLLGGYTLATIMQKVEITPDNVVGFFKEFTNGDV